MKPRVASLGRVAYLRYAVGPRTSARDRTAGDSSPVTQKGRSVPGTPGAGRIRPIPRSSRPPRIPLHRGATPRRRPLGAAAALTPVPTPRAPCRDRNRVHGALRRSRTSSVTRVTRRSRTSATTKPIRRGSSMQHHQELEGRCTRRGVQRPLLCPGFVRRARGVRPSSAGPPACRGTAAAGRRRPRPGPRGTSVRPPRAVRTPRPAAGAGPPRPCSARRTWRARPGR